MIALLLSAQIAISTADETQPVSAEELRKTLSIFGPPNGESAKELEKLVAALDSTSFAERSKALKDLAARPVLPGHVLALAETHPDLEVRYQIKRLRDDPDKAKRAAELLKGTFDSIVRENVEGLAGAVIGALPSARESNMLSKASAALLATATEEDRQLLLDTIRDESTSDEFRAQLVPVLGKVGGEEAENALSDLLRSEDLLLKQSAAWALAKRGNKAALPVLGELLDAENLLVRLKAVSALRDLTGQEFGFRPGLKKEDRAEAAKKWRDWLAENLETAKLGKLGEEIPGVDLSSDLSGWVAFDSRGREGEPGDLGWDGKGKMLRIDGTKGSGSFLRTRDGYENYVLKFEWQNVPGSFGDSGIGIGLAADSPEVPSYLEVQILPNKTGDLYRIGDFEAIVDDRPLPFNAAKKKPSNEKPAGEWNEMEIKMLDGKMDVRINGELQNSAEGLPEGERCIVIRNEGYEVLFRNMIVIPVK